MKIGIAGAGGIGSNVAVHLVRAGAKYIKIVDFDKIEKSNLNRQFYFQDQIGMYKSDAVKINLERIGSRTEIKAVNMKIESDNVEDIFRECDIVVEAFDKKEYKKLIAEKLGAIGKKLVCASGIGGTATDKVEIKKFGKNIVVTGDFESDIKDFKTYSHKVSMVAALMAGVVMEIGGAAFED